MAMATPIAVAIIVSTLRNISVASETVIAADCAADRNIELAQISAETKKKLDEHLPAAWSGNNPIDVLGDADPDRFKVALASCLEDDGVDGALAILVPQSISDPEAVAERVADLADEARKPMRRSKY